MTLSLADDQPVKLSISTDTASERDYLPPVALLSNKLLLAAAGYISLEYMTDVERNGGYYLMRATKQLNPTITLALNAKEQEIKSLADLKLKELLQRRGERTPVLDLDVKWPHFQCRVVWYCFGIRKRNAI